MQSMSNEQIAVIQQIQMQQMQMMQQRQEHGTFIFIYVYFHPISKMKVGN